MLLMETIEAFAQLSDFPTNCSFSIFALLEFFCVFSPQNLDIFRPFDDSTGQCADDYTSGSLVVSQRAEICSDGTIWLGVIKTSALWLEPLFFLVKPAKPAISQL